MLVAVFILVVCLTLAAFMVLRHFESRRELRQRLKRRPPGAKGGAVAATPADRFKAVTDRVAARAARYYETSDPTGIKTLRLTLIRAGFFDPRAVGRYFAFRILLALGGLLASVALLRAGVIRPTVANQAMVCMSLTICGYFLPGLFLRNRLKQVTLRNKLGFPDFLDLMVVCAEAGLSIEAAFDRVGRELGPSYPELSTHLSIASLEMRAGHAMEAALKTLSERLGLEEVRAFATLLQQSRELGTSLAEALKVYSEEMRHKRLSLAEEKAYALPAKLSIPVTGFILPVVLLVAILPSIVRFVSSNF